MIETEPPRVRAASSANTKPGLQRIAFVLSAICFLFFLQIYPNFINPNESSRLLLTSAIVDDQTFQIDRAILRYGDTQDKSLFNGHYYTAKPIGYSLLAVPFYLLLKTTAGTLDIHMMTWGLRLFLNLLPLLLFSLFLLRYLQLELEIGPASYLLLASLLFGSLFFTYAQLFMSHVLTGIFWFLAFHWLVDKETNRYAALAGALLGLSFVMEILTAIPLAACAIWLLVRRRSALPAFAVFAFLFGLPAFLYNYFVFGNPLTWTYEHVADPTFQRNNAIGYVGLSFPQPKVLWELTFGSSRGFFFFMPHLLLGAWGLIAERARRPAAVLAVIIIACNFLVVSGFTYWEGGWCLGPRYLVPLVPLFVYGAALWLRRPRTARLHSAVWYTYLALLGITIPAIFFGTVTFPFPPVFPFLVAREYWILFWRGFFGLNWGDFIGFSLFTTQLVALLLIFSAALSFILLSRLDKKHAAVFVLAIALHVGISGALQPSMQNRIDAWQCYVIGLTGYYQGHYLKALEFFRYSLERDPEPRLKELNENMIAYIHSLADQK